MIRFLPAITRSRGDSLGAPVLQVRAAASCSLDGLQSASDALRIPLQDFLMIGFVALLCRLTRQERITLSTQSSTFEFTLDPDSSFASVAASLNPADWAENAFAQPVVRKPLRGIEAMQNAAYYAFSEAGHTSVKEDPWGLSLSVLDGGRRLEMASASGLWNETTLAEWLGFLNALLQAAARQPYDLIRQLPLWSEAAAQRFYADLNTTEIRFQGPETVVGRFLEQAKKTPESTAVISGERRYTYRELDERSTRLARRLVANGAGAGRSVAVCMDRSIDLLNALVAVLKSGSYYVPLEPSHPGPRLRGILEECNPVALLTDSVSASGVLHWIDSMGVPVIQVDQAVKATRELPNLPASIAPGDLAYTIYTSGTTGKPKGVRIPHRALHNLICSIQQQPGMSASDRVLAVAPISFDIATMDMFLPICSGATLVIASRSDAVDPYRLARLIDVHNVTSLQATPATWRLLITAGWKGKRDLRMLCGGEALSKELATSLLRLGGELWNCYGPTETTIWSSVLRLHLDLKFTPVGPPLANTSFYVMDALGNLLPPGVPGELCIGGVGVSPGYVARPELNAERFIADRFGKDSDGRLFRTGDLVRIVDGHLLEFFGRLDHQVKLRGYRIELGEIESILRSHPDIADAVVILREDIPGEPRLVAYIIAPDTAVEGAAVLQFASESLPEYMLPSAVVPVERFPLSTSGKIDRRALPLPESLPNRSTIIHPLAEDPTDELEEKLLRIFRETLRNHAIGVTDSFFRFGGYSLLTIRLFARIDRELHSRLPISLLFDAPTVRELARVIRSGVAPSVVVPIRPFGKSAPIFLIQSYLLYSAMLEIVEPDRPIYGLRELGDEREPATVAERAQSFAHEILAICPTGPLYLAGWCAAGTLTVEIARQLRETGHEVGLVALFDAERPGYAPPRNLSALLLRGWKKIVFHWVRLRRIAGRERSAYILEALERNMEALADGYYAIAYRTMHWLQRRLPVALPATAFHRAHANMSTQPSSSVRPYPGRLNLYRAADVADRSEPDASLGWAEVAGEGVAVAFVEGDHISMFKKPHVDNLAELLQQEMRRHETAAVRS